MKKTIYYPKMKKAKLGFFSEILLRWCGKKDYKANIIYINKEGHYYSSFVEQEIELCLVAIEKEKELLNNIILNYCHDLQDNEIEIARIDEIIESIENKKFDKNDVNIMQDDMSGALMEFHKRSEQRAKENAQKRELDLYFKELMSKKQNVSKFQLSIDSCIRISKIRCKQYYHILQARIAAYFRGAFSGDDNNILINEKIMPNEMFKVVIYAIDNFESMFTDGKYANAISTDKLR